MKRAAVKGEALTCKVAVITVIDVNVEINVIYLSKLFPFLNSLSTVKRYILHSLH